MLTSLPGGQAYLDGTVAVAAEQFPGVRRQRFCWVQARKNLTALCSGVEDSFCAGSQTLGRDAHVLSAAAVRLVLELQLLAAGAVQRLRDHPESVADADWQCEWVTSVLYFSNILLQHQVRALLQAGSSCLPPEVLQQAGLTLLQALAAPVQQLQLSGTGSPNALLQPLLMCEQGIDEQLYVLRAAASGLEPAEDHCEWSLQRITVSGACRGSL
jgi:hypothetical protein